MKNNSVTHILATAVAAMLALSLAACGSTSASQDAQESAKADTKVVSEVKADDKAETAKADDKAETAKADDKAETAKAEDKAAEPTADASNDATTEGTKLTQPDVPANATTGTTATTTTESANTASAKTVKSAESKSAASAKTNTAASQPAASAKSNTASTPAKSSTSATAKPAASQPASSKPATSTAKPAAQPATQTNTTTAQPVTTSKAPSASELANQRAQVLAATNAARRNAGLSELKEDASLDAFAQTRAKELTVLYSHNRPAGSAAPNLPSGMTLFGSNIAAGYSDGTSVVNDGWMKSDDHRGVMLDETPTFIGIGYYNGYWVQEFGCTEQTSVSTQTNADTMSRDDYIVFVLGGGDGGATTYEEAEAKAKTKYGY